MASSHIGGFERYWNSTFGIPQQILLRMLRAAQDPNVSLLSRDGLLDPALLPIAGIWTGDRRDVTMKEGAERLGMGEGTAAELGVGILTDPLTYMTFGWSAAAKASRGANIALRNPQVSKSLLAKNADDVSGLLKGGFKRDDVLGAIDDALGAGKMSAKDARRVAKARRSLAAIPENQTLETLNHQANQKDLVFGLPFLNKWGLGVTVAKDEKSWFRYLNRSVKNSTGGKALAHAARPLMKVPVLREAMGTLAGVVEGARQGGKALRVLDEGRAAKAMPEAVAWFDVPGRAQVIDKVRKQSFGDVYARYIELSEKPGFTPQRALVSAVYGSASKNPEKYNKKFVELWTAITGGEGGVKGALEVMEGGKGQLDSLTVEKALRGFMDDLGRNTDTLVHNQEAMRLTEAGSRNKELRQLALRGGLADKAKYGAYKFGRNLRTLQRRMFRSDGSVEELMATEQTLKKLTARGTEYLQRLGRDGAKLLRNAADEVGVKPDDFDKFMNSFLQASAPADELTVIQHFTNPNNIKTAEGVISYAARMNTATQEVMNLALGGKPTGALGALSAQVATMMGRGLSKTDATKILGVFDGEVGLTRLVTEADTLAEITKNGVRSDGVRFLPGDGRFLGTMTDEELAGSLLRLQDEMDPRMGYMRSEIQEVLKARKAGKTKVHEVLGGAKTTPAPGRRVDHVYELLGKQDGVIAFDELDGELARTAAYLMQAGTEMRRAITNGVPVGPGLVEDVLNATNRHSRLMDAALERTMGEAGKKYFGWLREVQGATLNEAVRNGLLGGGMAPLAYVGRIIGPAFAKIEQALLNEKFSSVIDKALPKLGSSMLRNADAMTIEELNALHRAAMEQAGPRAKEFVELLDEIAEEATGVRFGKYTESPHVAMLTRLAQGVQRSVSRGFFHDALEAGAETGTMFGGKVIGYVTKSKEYMLLGSAPRVRKGKFTGALGEVKYDRQAIESDFGGVLVLDHRGEEHFIGPELFASGGSVVNVGKYKGLEVELLDEAGEFAQREFGDEVELAFSTRASRGQLGPGEIMGAETDIIKRLDDLDGAYIGWGDESALAGSFTALQKQYSRADEVLIGYDLAQQTIKAWQTTMRPSFHIANVASLIPMMATMGVKAHNSVFGMFDAHRFLTRNAEGFGAYSKIGAYTATKVGKGGFIKGTRELSENVRRIEGGVFRGRSAEALAAKGIGPDDADELLIFRAKDGSEYEVGEILHAIAEEGLLGTFISQGMRGSSRASQALQIIRDAAFKGDEGGKIKQGMAALGKGLRGRGEGMEAIAESSEIFARLSGVFGQLREGVPLQMAVRNTKMAMVDYANITAFERQVMKRAVTYYTFPRHYLPQAWKKFAQDPEYMANLSAVLRSKGVVKDNNGRTEVDLGPLGILNYERMNPNIEAVKLLQAIGHTFLGGTSAVTPLGDQAYRESQLQGAPTQPFTFGSAAGVITKALDGDDRTSGMEELANAFWFTRYLLDPGDPYGEKTPLVKAFESTVLPVKGGTPVRHRKMLVSRFNGLIRELERKAELTDDPETRAELRVEARRLSQVVRQRLEEID